MSNHAPRIEPVTEQIDLFQCEAGCFHFEFGCTLLTFSKETFHHIAELFAEAKKSLDENERQNEWAEEILTEVEL